MTEAHKNTDPAQASVNPLLEAWQTPFQTPPFDEIAPEHFLPAFEQAFVDHASEIAAITHDPSAPDFANTITALERSGKLLAKVAAVFYDLVSAHSNPAILEIDKEVSLRMARHWNPIMMNAVLFGRIAMLHDNRGSLKLDRRRDAAVGAHLHPLPPRGRGLERGGQEADGRDQRAARLSRHYLQPSSARRRAGLVPGALRGRLRRAFRKLRCRRQGGRRGARHGRKSGRDPVALVRRAVPEELGQARPAGEGLQGLHRPRRQWQRQRQQRHHRRDPGAARGKRQASRLSDLCRLSAGGFHGQDARGRARPAGAGLEAGTGPGAGRPRRVAGADLGGGRQFRARPVGLALLRRKAQAAPRQFRRRRDQAVSGARSHDRGRLRLRHPPVRRYLHRTRGHSGLASRRPGLGGQGCGGPPQGAVLRRLLCKVLEALRRLDDVACATSRSSMARWCR